VIWNFRRIIGLVVIVGGMLMVAGLLFLPIDKATIPPEVWGILGAIIGWGGSVVSYEFGSSSGGRALALKQIEENEG
jgi:hypothetical protein